MKKCMLMFALLITVLLLAVYTEVKQNSEFEQELAIGEDVTENSLLGKEIRDSIR